MKGLIICGGVVDTPQELRKYINDIDVVICADKGGLHAKNIGIFPNLLLGDMDSIPKDILEEYKNKNVDMEIFSSEKDMTDSEIAIWRAVTLGCTQLVIIGALGGRVDQSIANIFILKKLLEQGVDAVIVNEKNEVRLIKDKIELLADKLYKLSLIPLTQKVTGITTKGLKYSLNNGELEIGKSVGVSNEFEEDLAQITIKDGLLLVIKSKD